MGDDGRVFVIVGASLAGAKAAEQLRHDGFTGQVVLINQAARTIVGLPANGGDRTPPATTQLDWRRLDGTPLPPGEWPHTRALLGERFDDVELILVRPDGARPRLRPRSGQGVVGLSRRPFRAGLAGVWMTFRA